jgi:hypothetical protein
MKYAVEMGSIAMMHISSIINIGSGIQHLMGGGINRQSGWWLRKLALRKQAKSCNSVKIILRKISILMFIEESRDKGRKYKCLYI